MPTEIEWAWLAGLYEGEGTFYCSRNPQVCLRIKMQDQDIIERCKAITGVGTLTFSVGRQEGYKDVHGWEVRSQKDIELVLRGIWNHLGERRKCQARTVLLTFHTYGLEVWAKDRELWMPDFLMK